MTQLEREGTRTDISNFCNIRKIKKHKSLHMEALTSGHTQVPLKM